MLLARVGKDVVITFDLADAVTLKGVTLSALQQHLDHFAFL